MSTFVISLLVVGSSIVLVARTMLHALPQPATDEHEHDRATDSAESATVRAPHPAPPAIVLWDEDVVEVDLVEPTPWWHRTRSGAALAALLTSLGLLLAVATAMAFFAATNLIRDALG